MRIWTHDVVIGDVEVTHLLRQVRANRSKDRSSEFNRTLNEFLHILIWFFSEELIDYFFRIAEVPLQHTAACWVREICQAGTDHSGDLPHARNSCRGEVLRAHEVCSRNELDHATVNLTL